jgi:circadian clock protein KaiC
LYDEPGVFLSFEESEDELVANVTSLGFDLRDLIKRKKLAVDQVRVEADEIEETGTYDLEGLFVRLQLAIDSVGAKRVALDSIESLFSALPNPAILRSELRRLFRWLKDRGQTVIITGERGEGTLTRHGLEEYVSDCVIFLDHRVSGQISTRRMRIVKYRGSLHGTNEYPFLIDKSGISVMPITSLGLGHEASGERCSSGLPRLDEMLGGKGYYKGTTVLISGTAGTGKSSFAAVLVRATCRAGDRCLMFAYEESSSQIIRNMRSIGVDLEPHLEAGRLRIVATRAYALGLEDHLFSMHRAINEFAPSVVVVDPINSFTGAPGSVETCSMLTRLIDFLKVQRITTLFTSLTSGSAELEETDVEISSLIDTWLMLEAVKSGGERNRVLNIIKSRGMAHSNQAAEYLLSSEGIHILDTYLGPSGVLTGAARVAREAEDQLAVRLHDAELARKRALLESRRKAFEGRLTALREEFAARAAELTREISLEEAELERLGANRDRMAQSRGAFAVPTRGKPRGGPR